MFERFRDFLSLELVDKPKEWEDSVVKSIEILRFQMDTAKVASNLDNFQAQEHSQRVKTRVGNLKDEVINIAGKERSIFVYPRWIPVQSSRTYYYIPAHNKLKFAEEQLVANGISGFLSIPNLASPMGDIDETIWCLDRKIVEDIAR